MKSYWIWILQDICISRRNFLSTRIYLLIIEMTFGVNARIMKFLHLEKHHSMAQFMNCRSIVKYVYPLVTTWKPIMLFIKTIKKLFFYWVCLLFSKYRDYTRCYQNIRVQLAAESRSVEVVSIVGYHWVADTSSTELPSDQCHWSHHRPVDKVHIRQELCQMQRPHKKMPWRSLENPFVAATEITYLKKGRNA